MLARSRALALVLLATLFAPVTLESQTTAAPRRKPVARAAPNPLTDAKRVCERCLRAHMEFLASDALRGRGSATHDELVAATYIASQLKLFGIQPAGKDGYLQTAELHTPTLGAPPTLAFTHAGAAVTWTHGKEFILSRTSGTKVRGPLQKMGKEVGTSNPGAVVLWQGDVSGPPNRWAPTLAKLTSGGAAAVLIPAPPDTMKNWEQRIKTRPFFGREVAGVGPSAMLGEQRERDLVLLRPEALEQLAELPEGAAIEIETHLGEPKKEWTTNVVGILRGTAKDADRDVILLTAHLDHLGVAANRTGDNVFNGASDDASGCATVLELARALAAGPKPRRTVVFAFFGSEELGGLGVTYFLKHTPVPLEHITANVEFEMLTWPDPNLKPNQLWMTGWDRTNLGPELAKHGANLTADPYPQENFFQRSDNYVLAKKGVVAQTIGSFGLQKWYHTPEDDLSRVDWPHFLKAVDSLIAPTQWLVNSTFKPEWLPGKKP